MLKNRKLWAGLTSVLILVLALASFLGNLAFTRAGDVNRVLGTTPPTQDVTVDTNYIPSDYAGQEEMRAALKEYLIDSQIQGSVLLKNENNALPLEKGDNLTLIGGGAVNPIYHSGASASGNMTTVSLIDALSDEGFKLNQDVITALNSADTSYNLLGNIGEVPVSTYNNVKSSFSVYGDAAVYVMRRYGGEEGDLNHGMGETPDWQSGPVGVPELSLHTEERETLKLLNENFDKVIVILNSANPIELDWLDSEEYGADACLWIAYPGAYGFLGVADILSGDADPSGRLVDTYAANSLSSPAMQNTGDFGFTNLSSLYRDSYLVYSEGIYVGYKYYETRYNDLVLGMNNANSSKGKYASAGSEWNYADEIVFPFGSGMSYADFTQELVSVDWNMETHEVTVQVKVTNGGDETYSGKSRDVVQLYVQLPWEKGQAEKSAIQLVDFEKSIELGPGESEDITLTFSDYLFATYDENAVNGADTSKTGCYVFDAGDYYFSIGENAHDALNNVLAARGVEGLYDENGNQVAGDSNKAYKETLEELDNVSYATSPYTGEVVSNLFEDRDLNYFIEDSVTYLTRFDWNTFPDPVLGITATDVIKDLMENAQYEKPSDAPSVSEFNQSVDSDIEFFEMRNVDFDDDEKWEQFIDQLSLSELCRIVGDQRGIKKIDSINMPDYNYGNGPSGLEIGGILFNAEIVTASSFSKDVLSDRGYFMAEESYYVSQKQISAPGANIHRTPYSGRNAEYYSEDAIMSYICGREQAGAMAEKGLVSLIKHFVANDQETNRHGVATFMTEQTYREIYLKGFEGAMSSAGGSLGVMTSYNRIGCVPAASDTVSLEGVTRNEWGFKGINMTDSSKDASQYMFTADCLVAGSTQFCNDPDRSTEVMSLIASSKDGYVWQRLRDAAKYYFYSMSRTTLVNGLSKGVVVEDFVPWWQPAIITACVVIGVITVASAAMFIYSAYFAGRSHSKKNDTADGR